MNPHLAALVSDFTTKDRVLNVARFEWQGGKNVTVALCMDGEIYVTAAGMLPLFGVSKEDATCIGLKCKHKVNYRGSWAPYVYYTELRELVERDYADKAKDFDWPAFERQLYVSALGAYRKQVDSVKADITELKAHKRMLEERWGAVPWEGTVKPAPKRPRTELTRTPVSSADEEESSSDNGASDE